MKLLRLKKRHTFIYLRRFLLGALVGIVPLIVARIAEARDGYGKPFIPQTRWEWSLIAISVITTALICTFCFGPPRRHRGYWDY